MVDVRRQRATIRQLVDRACERSGDARGWPDFASSACTVSTGWPTPTRAPAGDRSQALVHGRDHGAEHPAAERLAHAWTAVEQVRRSACRRANAVPGLQARPARLRAHRRAAAAWFVAGALVGRDGAARAGFRTAVDHRRRTSSCRRPLSPDIVAPDLLTAAARARAHARPVGPAAGALREARPERRSDRRASPTRAKPRRAQSASAGRRPRLPGRDADRPSSRRRLAGVEQGGTRGSGSHAGPRRRPRLLERPRGAVVPGQAADERRAVEAPEPALVLGVEQLVDASRAAAGCPRSRMSSASAA